jgi:hypothetical protein
VGKSYTLTKKNRKYCVPNTKEGKKLSAKSGKKQKKCATLKRGKN